MECAVVPLEERVPNEVDRLRSVCQHDYRLLDARFRPGSEFVARSLGPYGPEPTASFIVRCLHCSANAEFLFSEHCPACLGKMERYFSTSDPKAKEMVQAFEAQQNGYWTIGVWRCNDCGLQFGSSWFDQ